jgi:hypothetical protein
MNDAKIILSVEELALLSEVAGYSSDRGISDLPNLRKTLDAAVPGEPFHLTAEQIKAADEAFLAVDELGILPRNLPSSEQRIYHRVKAMIAAAAVD